MYTRLKVTPQHFKVLSFVWIGVIFMFSLQDGTTSSLTSGLITQSLETILNLLRINLNPRDVAFWVRKFAHFIEYVILGGLALKSAPLFKRLPLYPLMFIVPVLDETLQLFVPGRAGTLQDVLIDVAGLLFALVLFQLTSTNRNSFPTKSA